MGPANHNEGLVAAYLLEAAPIPRKVIRDH